MGFRVIIPARFLSSRLPGKPLRTLAGKPLIQHVYERASRSLADEVIIATDDERIRAVAESFGAAVCMTAITHHSGTDRIAEVVRARGYDEHQIVVNVQGDEPLVPPALINQVAATLEQHRDAQVATLCRRIDYAADLFDPHVVKVALDRNGYALYFSRAAIPWDREAFSVTLAELPKRSEHYRHIGLYAYRTAYLREYVTLPPCAIETMEALEQLRVLWNGGRIQVAEAMEEPGRGVDTEDDLRRVEVLLAAEDNVGGRR
ncbi:MAG: 3-deoxy-manno-octulosonate cytidylyltransferase (CMP-KDO synthetase) [Gammaproteobacteria bacterium]|nr:MAG: 3-deoxy-manno-octulosonate cytidylyltransferase (CMP-KDO synthetase) [Gammaproteobacteria bacterium]TND06846.1 MAG: 3-deoxy-manno-octulosonate cytidylyltransferase (CMP-KDO synthetase) [Gammaproteobacteria bacterium]